MSPSGRAITARPAASYVPRADISCMRGRPAGRSTLTTAKPCRRVIGSANMPSRASSRRTCRRPTMRAPMSALSASCHHRGCGAEAVASGRPGIVCTSRCLVLRVRRTRCRGSSPVRWRCDNPSVGGLKSRLLAGRSPESWRGKAPSVGGAKPRPLAGRSPDRWRGEAPTVSWAKPRLLAVRSPVRWRAEAPSVGEAKPRPLAGRRPARWRVEAPSVGGAKPCPLAE